MILEKGESLTAKYLSGKMKIPTPKIRRKTKSIIKIEGASQNNLKNINVQFGKGVITAVTGVSGAGKSSLVIETLQKSLEKNILGKKIEVGKHKNISGYEDFSRIINTSKGQCQECRGLGERRVELLFLSDVWIQCQTCKGKRYKKKILSVKYKRKSIFDVLDMTIAEAERLFSNIEKIHAPLKLAVDVGLGYLKMGQPTTTLSGGEAERLKIARELAKRTHDKSIYILDEPSQGLHFFDIEKLVNILHKLANEKNTIVVIDHNMDIIKNADQIIDLGPEGGERNGGYLVASGTVKEIIEKQKGYTWKYLKKVL
ncbi:MAG: ATP-binding cassette domain-containing protein [Candidatus Heimdallarchaeaceae archaeon]